MTHSDAGPGGVLELARAVMGLRRSASRRLGGRADGSSVPDGVTVEAAAIPSEPAGGRIQGAPLRPG
jgi:hypothetical protein